MSYWVLKGLAFDVFHAHPWSGIGVGRFHTATSQAFDAGRLNGPYRAIDPHCTLLGAMAEAGLWGGLSVVALFVAAVGLARSAARRSPDRWLVGAVTAGLVGVAVNSINADVLNFRFVWIALAVLRALA